MVNRCQSCGGVLDPGTKVCPHCGAKVRRSYRELWILLFFAIGVGLGLLLLDRWRVTLPASPEGAESMGEEAPAAAAKTPSPPAVRRAKEGPEYEPYYCDRAQAQAVREKAREIAEITVRSEEVTLHLGEEWAYYSEGLKASFVTKFTDSDTCLNGHPRQITFYYRGALVARVESEGGITVEP